MLEEPAHGRFKEGVESSHGSASGRFTFSSPHSRVGPTTSRRSRPANIWWLTRLALVWAEFSITPEVPIVNRSKPASPRGDYLRLLRNLRQQVMEGSRWISRAASSLSVEHTEIRAEFIHHASEEQRDFQMLERDYVAAGGHIDEIVGAAKNVGSEALSAYMFQEASKPNPIHLLGAMYIIEGLGAPSRSLAISSHS